MLTSRVSLSDMTTQTVTENTRYLQKLGRWRDGTLSHHWITLEIIRTHERLVTYTLVGSNNNPITEPLKNLLNREYRPVPIGELPEQFKTGVYAEEDEEKTENNDFDQWLAENYFPAGKDASNGEQWFLSNSPHEFMPTSLSKLREQYNLDNKVTDIKEYHLVVSKTQTSETLYHRDITEEAPLDLSTFDLENYLDEVEQKLGFKLSPELPYPGDGDVRVTIGFSPTPFSDVMLWSSKDFYLEN